MAKYGHFEELPVWQSAARLYNLVLDLFEKHSARFTPGFRGQLDRAALSVSNNIAEGFDRVTTAELVTFLGYSRASASEVRSMIRVVRDRPTLAIVTSELGEIHDHAQSCLRQIVAWTSQIEEGTIQGKRHLTGPQKRQRSRQETADFFRQNFLKSLSPTHPLYNTPEARQARGDPVQVQTIGNRNGSKHG